MILTTDNTIYSDDGKILFFSIEKFKNDICYADNCFICGKITDNNDFNDEHVIPKWILSKFQLFSSNITLPNQNSFRYDKYKIKCCKDCNALLGDTFEVPRSNAFSKDYNHFLSFIRNNFNLLYSWLSFIFFKTQLCDKAFKLSYSGNEKISDTYDWESLHHLHCILRSIYTKSTIDKNVFGSLAVLPALQSNNIENFDYLDIHESKTILLRINDIAIIAVLNDSCAILNLYSDYIKKITGPLNPIQLRELTVKFAYTNLLLIDRPKYYSNIDFKSNSITIKTKLPNEIDTYKWDPLVYGNMLYRFLEGILKTTSSPDLEDQISNLKKGILTYILDDTDKFNMNSMLFIESD